MDLAYKNCLWTRVVPGALGAEIEVPLFLLKDDLKSLDTTQNTVARGRPRELKKYFDPEDYSKENESLLCEERKLSSDDLHQFQLQVFEIQEKLKKRALDEHFRKAREDGLPEEESERIVSKLHRSYTRKTRGLRLQGRQERSLNIENRPCRQKRRMKDLSLEDKIQIAFEITVLKRLFSDISESHSVKMALIQSIASKVKHNPAFFRELRSRCEHKDRCEDAVKVTTSQQLEEGVLIEKAQQIKERVKADHQLDVSQSLVRQVFKQHLGMKYKKIKRTMYTANREKNLCLRFEYSKVMISLLQEKMRVINVDETWIGESDFRRRKW